MEAKLPVLLARFQPHISLSAGSPVLDIGAAQGAFVATLARAGFDAHGVEPWDEALAVGPRLAESVGTDFQIVAGSAESLPFADASFELVHAQSVFEHVVDPDRAFSEAFRVLRPGGGLYFYSTNALCPRQAEIRRFPAFGWYPQPLKRRIMDWAIKEHPELVGHTELPAYHWYTPWGVRRSLHEVGFRRILDRWDLKRPEEVSGARRTVLALAARNRATKLVGDVLVPESSYLAVK